jgi:glutamate carboxypeptidase
VNVKPPSRPRVSLVGPLAVAAAAPVEQAASAVRARTPAAWEVLEELVNIGSGSEDVSGLARAIGVMRSLWGELGLETTIEHTAGRLPVLHVRRDGNPALPTIALIGHLDTVFPSEIAAAWRFARRGDRASGPGVADAKGGAVVAWLAVAAALEATRGLPHLNLRVLLNTDEETGSVQSRAIIERLASEIDLALLYEPGRPDGSVVSGRRGAHRYRITVKGKAAHSGVAPWDGVNALEAAAHKIIALQALNDRERLVSVTVAIAQGGSRLNVVPDEAVLDVDTRLPDLDVAVETHAAVERIVARTSIAGSSATYQTLSERPPMTPHPDVDGILSLLSIGAQRIGQTLTDVATGGGSDGCFTSARGVPTIDGLGPVGGGYHTRGEYVRVATLAQRAALSAALLSILNVRRLPAA